MMEFTDEEVETIKEIICEWGSDCPCTDYEKVQELKYKLGLEKRPTAEELAEQERKRKEFVESPMGKLLVELMNRHSYFDEIIKNPIKLDIAYGIVNLVGSNLKIKLPENYNIKELPNV